MGSIEQFIKDKSDVSKMIMRRIDELIELLNEVGEVEIYGYAKGWEYNLKKTEEIYGYAKGWEYNLKKTEEISGLPLV